MVKDINSGSSGSYPEYFTSFGNEVYFSANNSFHGYELWKTDGTSSGTVMVKDINIGSDSSMVTTEFVEFGNALYFRATDGINGSELWSSNGTVTELTYS